MQIYLRCWEAVGFEQCSSRAMKSLFLEPIELVAKLRSHHLQRVWLLGDFDVLSTHLHVPQGFEDPYPCKLAGMQRNTSQKSYAFPVIQIFDCLLFIRLRSSLTVWIPWYLVWMTGSFELCSGFMIPVFKTASRAGHPAPPPLTSKKGERKGHAMPTVWFKNNS